jgi:O-antigen ligase
MKVDLNGSGVLGGGGAVRKKIGYWLLMVALIFCASTYANIVGYFILDSKASESGGGLLSYHNLLISWLFISLGAISAFRLRDLNEYYFVLMLVLLPPIWFALSTLWSPNSFYTAKASVALGMSTLLGLLLWKNMRYFDSLAVVYGVVLAYLILSLLFVFWVPDFAIHQSGTHEGLWKGAFNQKNKFAHEAVLLVFLSLGLFVKSSLSRFISCILGLGVGALILINAGSVTANVVLLISLLFFLWCLAIQKLPYKRLLLILPLLFMGLLALYADEALSLLGRGASLTGRVGIWVQNIQAICQSPWVGYGYLASRELQEWSLIVDYGSHNGYIATQLWGGVVASAALCLLILGAGVGLLLKLMGQNWERIDYLLSVIFFGFLVLNFTEDHFWGRSGYWWPLFVAASVYFLAFLSHQLPFRGESDAQ